MPKTTLIRNGRVIDPSQDIDEHLDVAFADGEIVALGRAAPHTADETIDAGGRIVAPGLIDMHVHLREPGQESKETIATGTAAAVAGGFTAVACMPNTDPALDDDTQIEFVLRQAAREGYCRVYPIGAITKGRRGQELAEIGLMLNAGAVAFSDDGDGIADAGVCYRAMSYVRMFDKLFIQHCEDKSLSAGGCMNAGPTATRLGLPGFSGLAEEVMTQRDVALVRATGVRYHVCHVSTAGCVDIIRRAKSEGLPVTTEVCPHHLLLTDEACVEYDPNTKMSPPLRSADDVAACLEGVRDGTIDCLITDHAPHRTPEKEMGFQDAPFGITGLETSLGCFVRALIEPEIIDWVRLISAMSTRQAELLGVPGGSLRVGEPADITIIDPAAEWVVDAERGFSKSSNTPFDGWTLRGKATHTIVGGQLRFAEGMLIGLAAPAPSVT